jgi:hypothetical protein
VHDMGGLDVLQMYLHWLSMEEEKEEKEQDEQEAGIGLQTIDYLLIKHQELFIFTQATISANDLSK